MAMTQLEPKVVAALKADAALSALVGGRVHPLRLPRGCTFPAVTYTRISNAPVNSAGGYSGLEFVRLQFNVWAEVGDRGGYGAAKDAARALHAALNAAVGFKASKVGDRDEYDDTRDLAGVEMDFIISHTEGKP